MNDDVQILNNDISNVIKAEMESQVDIAKRYPRNLERVLANIRTMATMDIETAEDCFYALQRGKGDDAKTIEGLSVRFAEIIANQWGNMKVGTRIISNDGKKITVQGVCHDLETNLFVSKEVVRSILTKTGQTYSEDMQVVTANAAQAIAFRNAVLQVIPRAITKKIVDDVKQMAIGATLDVEKKRTNALVYYRGLGITDQELLNHLNVASISDIDAEKVLYLSGLKTAIKEGSTTVHETFRKATEDKIEAAKTATGGNTMAALNKLGNQKAKDQAGKKEAATPPPTEQTPSTEEIVFPDVSDLSRNGSRDAKNAQVITDFLKSKMTTERFEEILAELELKDFIGIMDFALRSTKESVVAVFQYLV